MAARVTAADEDQGYNGNVTYYSTHLEEDSSCPFTIDSDNRKVKLNGDIDNEVFSWLQNTSSREKIFGV